MRRLLPVLLVMLAAVAIIIATRPPTYHVERSITIAAPAGPAFAAVNNFHHWEAWSPWGKLDPRMTLTFSGADSGKGAVYHWTGNKNVGEGQMTIVESVPNERVGILLQFIKPFASTSSAALTFTPAPGGTRVVWSMDGQQSLTVKAISLFMSMDQAVGKDFEKGLRQLKALAETGASPAGAAAADTARS